MAIQRLTHQLVPGCTRSLLSYNPPLSTSIIRLSMDAETLARTLEEFLAETPHAVVVEDGLTAFDLATARYSIANERGKCLLHLWSAENNAVRRVLGAERKRDALKVTVQRFGKARPSTLEVCARSDRRTPTARKRARTAYAQLLQRVLERHYGGFTVDKFSVSMDLERSFSPVYTRALVRRGGSATALLGVNRQETQSSVDAALTFGLLWFDYCRSRERRAHVEGLTLFVPPGTSAVVRERMAHLDPDAAKWQLYELEERDAALQEMDCSDRGNVATRLVHCPEPATAQERFAGSIGRVRSLFSEVEGPEVDAAVEIAVLSRSEIGFRFRGLEFARARMAPDPVTFRYREELVYGIGAAEHSLNDEAAWSRLRDLLSRLRMVRRASGPHADPWWRMAPERWLESRVIRDVSALDGRLDATWAYSQVPAFAASDRAMIDVLSLTRDGRLALLELKASEDIHLVLQGLDYWARVQWHQQRGEFQRFGYFPGRELSQQKPLLLLVAPAFEVHPATDTLLRYLSPEIEYELVGIDQRWRDGVRVVFRKRRDNLLGANV